VKTIQVCVDCDEIKVNEEEWKVPDKKTMRNLQRAFKLDKVKLVRTLCPECKKALKQEPFTKDCF